MRLPLALYSLSISLGPASAADRNVSANKIKYVITQNKCTVWPFKNRQNKILYDKGSLMKVESIAECSAILLACIKP